MGGGLTHSHLLLTLFQTVSSPGAMAACLVLTFTHSLRSDTFSWPSLCRLSSLALASLAHQSPPSSWEPVSSWQAASAAAAAAATVLSLYQLVLTQALTHSNPCTNEQTGARVMHISQNVCSPGTVHLLQRSQKTNLNAPLPVTQTGNTRLLFWRYRVTIVTTLALNTRKSQLIL